jgi:hypothetical protein
MMKTRDFRSDAKKLYAFWIGLFALLSIANGAEIVLTSDPPGALISVAGKEAGVTPLTLDLPGQPVEIASRFGPLGPLVHTLTPDENQVLAYQFKYEYGTIVVTCDRTDAALLIDGTGYGHPPAVLLVSPGKHRLFMTASNAPDKSREVEVAAGQRASVEMDFSGGSPETTKTSASLQSAPKDASSPPPAASPSPNGRGPKRPAADRTRVVWEEPPPLIPAVAERAKPEPSAALSPIRVAVVKREGKSLTNVASVNQSGNSGKRKAVSSPSPSVPQDTSKVQPEAKALWQAKEEELALEKEQIENRVKNSTGAIREQWKYRMAVLQEKIRVAKQKITSLK